MSDETENFDNSDDVHVRCERKLDEVLGVVAVVAAHARMLEKHENLIVGHAGELRRIRKSIDALDASVCGVIAHQKEMNQLLAGIHTLWARLDCVRPGKNTPSSEVRVVGGEEG